MFILNMNNNSSVCDKKIDKCYLNAVKTNQLNNTCLCFNIDIVIHNSLLSSCLSNGSEF